MMKLTDIVETFLGAQSKDAKLLPPKPPLWVIVGEVKDTAVQWIPCIVVKPTSNPLRMDWKSVEGRHVEIFDLGENPHLLEQVNTQIEKSMGEVIGTASKDGAFGRDFAHERKLNSIFKSLAL